MHLVYYHIGPKYWKTTRKIKIIRQEDYTEFRGKKKKRVLPEFSDSDSDFESPHPPKVSKSDFAVPGTNRKAECIDLTSDSEKSVIKELKIITSRVEAVEESLSQSLENYEELERVRRISTCLEEKNKSLERSLEELKKSFSCIICKSVAQFPWLITSCCALLMCKGCAERWILLESSCPHCRAVITVETSLVVNEVRSVGEFISKLGSVDEV